MGEVVIILFSFFTNAFFIISRYFHGFGMVCYSGVVSKNEVAFAAKDALKSMQLVLLKFL